MTLNTIITTINSCQDMLAAALALAIAVGLLWLSGVEL